MWSYECVFEHPEFEKTPSVGGPEETKMIQTSITVVADSGMKALKYAELRIFDHPFNELVAIVRRHPIVKILE
jgi:hypothetical protein